jgi:S-methylmethionine-dependent homocysteine/selenocysteine methylase
MKRPASMRATEERVLFLDGAMGAALAASGVRIDGPAWSSRAVVERGSSGAVSALHAAYDHAGAQIHTANTFRATQEALDAWAEAPEGLTVERWVERAIDCAREAIHPNSRLAASLSPVGDCWHPAGISASVIEAHRRQAAILGAGNVDLILCETFADPEEALVATRAAVATGLPVWTSLTAGPSGAMLTPAGLAAAASRLRDAGAERVLVNCTPASQTLRFVEALAATGVAFGAYANAGDPAERLGYLVDWGEPPPDRAELDRRAARYAELAARWVDAGAGVVGGCCGTTPAHLRALVARLGCHKAP